MNFVKYTKALIYITRSYSSQDFPRLNRIFIKDLIEYIVLKVLVQLRTNQKQDKIKLNFCFSNIEIQELLRYIATSCLLHN